MATFAGSNLGEVITPTTVSGSVTRIPAGSFPGAAADDIDGAGGNDSLNGGAGNDTIRGGGGDDTVYGGNGDDVVYSSGTGLYDAGAGSDHVFAGNGLPETLRGGSGVDLLVTTAWSGNYSINLGTGVTNYAGESFVQFEDILSGDGDDTLTGTSGANDMSSGSGDDFISALGGNDTVYGGSGNDTVYGGTGNDFVSGYTGNDTVYGGGGNDRVYGLSGNDELSGASGSDTLNGGSGRDTLYGGAGDDRFDYDFTSDSVGAGRDLITSFEFSTSTNPNDRIDLGSIDAYTGAGGNQAFTSVEGTGVGRLSFVDLANGHTLIRGNTSAAAGFELEIEVDDGATSAAFWSPTLDFIL
jgi:Ca2+-binding RTX toxin-like protein